ncbi:MAG TPA: hypothetical protein VF855_01125, partial [Acidimicrobiales bacterium]
MLAKRLLAVALAVGLVALALFIRQRIGDDGSAGPGTTAPSGDVTLVCATEMEVACDAVTN